MKELNDVLGYDLKIYQNQNWFCFSIDSVILANFANIKYRTKKILDIGCGNGIVSLILSLRLKNSNAKIDAVEIQEDLAYLAKDSIKYNNLESMISVYNQDIKKFSEDKNLYNSYDLIVTNPPYFKKDEKSTKNLDVHKTIARHEIAITIEDIINISNQLLKEGGSFCIVNRVDRFIEIIEYLKRYNLEPKYVRFVYNDINSYPCLFYLEALKNGSSGFIVDRPFILYNDSKESEEYANLIREVMK